MSHQLSANRKSKVEKFQITSFERWLQIISKKFKQTFLHHKVVLQLCWNNDT